MLAFALLLLPGCPIPADTKADSDPAEPPDTADTAEVVDTQESAVPLDGDGDGSVEGDDCDDADPAVHPGAEERCNNLDDDCDGIVDEEAVDAATWYADGDGDGFGAGSVGTSCAAPEGGVEVDGDCDDADSTVHPGAVDACDGVDNDCDEGTLESGVVLDGVPGFTSIQAAVDASAEGSVIGVCAGTYAEAIVVGHDLSIEAPAGAELTVVDAGGSGPALRIDGGVVSVAGLTFTGGVGVDEGSGARGGGIYAAGAESVSLVDVVVRGNEADEGGGIYAPELGDLAVDGGSIADNVATLYGGGILAGTATLSGVEIARNEAVDGAGVFIRDGAVQAWDAMTLDSNSAENVGGGAYVGLAATLTTTSVVFVGNRSVVYAAGAYLDEGSSLSDTSSVFDNNAADDKGGALYLRYATMTGAGTSFLGDVGSWGGAIMLYGSTAALDAASVQYCSAELGGAFYVYATSSLSLTNSIVQSNVATAGGGARLRTTSTLISDNTDWGVDGTDNTPDDIDVSNDSTWSWDAAASFTCTNDADTCE